MDEWGRRLWPSAAAQPLQLPAAAVASTDLSKVKQLVFFATHQLNEAERRLFRHYSRQLRYGEDPVSMRMWVLVYNPQEQLIRPLSTASDEVEDGVCIWGDGALRRLFPLLGQTVDTHRGLAATPNENHRRYWWFHASLSLWNDTFGHAYPSVKYWWRIEPDVLFSGSWQALLLRTLPTRVSHDVLLPRLTTYEKDPTSYPHWAFNQHILKGTPKSNWVYSLVSIGRYSTRFMGHMRTLWAAGTIGYEEIFLPVTCLQMGTSACSLGSFQRLRSGGWRSTPIAKYFRYRPTRACSEFLPAAVGHTQELWHPVKNRACWVNYLDSCTSSGCNASVLLDLQPTVKATTR